MRLSDIGNKITENMGLKVISLALAIVLWLYVTAQQLEVQTFKVPIELVNIPDGLVLTGKTFEDADVSIKGARIDLLKLRLFGKLKAVVDCSDAKVGRVNMHLSPAALTLPEDFDIRNVSIDNPRIIVLEFEKLVTKSVPVKIAYRGQVPKDIIIRGKPIIVPEKVEIRGPKRVVSSISVVSTEEIDLRGRKKKFSEEVPVKKNRGDMEIKPQKVWVEIELSHRAVRTLANIPPTLLQDEESISVDYSPKTVSLTIEGPEEIVNNVAKDNVSIIIDATTKKEGTYRVEPQVIVPKGIEKYWLDIESFEIKVYRKSTGKGK